ncbi:MAG: uroporphyrinogen-III C-methyltransferase [Eubacteriales bacterium]|nr:uroporphyrinogen-III C-methyltransferase [Eubacteriales bacterium]
MENRGKVYLIGAGPGDKGLLTVKATELIGTADVIVYDRLVSNSIMGIIPENTKLIDVGKNVGNHPVPQYKINEILVEEALKGQKVVRLKGGDPFVFGRGGEELELLSENNIEFEVVPGITSSISVPAYAGIPVTHRDFCSSLHIITGHAKAGSEINIDFDALVRLNGTLIFMMSVSTVGQIAKGLMEAKMDGEMPCAVIENGTYSNQRKFISDLSNIERTVIDNNVKSPAVIVVGKVCSLSDKFDWFTELPLKGKEIIVTQPRSKSSKLEGMLRKEGAGTTLYPCIRTEFIRPINPPFEDYNTLVFTSGEGVKSFFSWLIEKGLDSRSLYGKKIACIGSQTAVELKKYGLKADFIPSIFDGEHLAKEMVSKGFLSEGDKVILLRAKIGTQDITRLLDEEGIDYLDYPVYETYYVEHEEIENLEEFDYITFTSKSCVDGFVATQKRKDFTGIKALCIGKQTAAEAEKYGFTTVISQVATVDSMVREVIENAK